MATQQPNNTHDDEEPHDMIAEAVCRFGSLMETALLHHLTRTVDTTDTRNEKQTSAFQEGLKRFREAEKENWDDIEDPAKYQRWIREGCPLRNEEEDFSEFFEETKIAKELQEEMESFTLGMMSVRYIPDYTYAFRLPLIFTNGWQVEIYAQDEGDGTFGLYGYDREGKALIYDDQEDSSKIKKLLEFLGKSKIEYTDLGYAITCTRKELPKMVYLLGIFLQTLSFCKMIEE